MIRMARKAVAQNEAAPAPAKKAVAPVSAKKTAAPASAKKAAAPAPAKKEAALGSAKKAAAPAPAKKPAPTLTTTDIGDHLAATFDIPKSHAKIYLTEAVGLITKHLKKGNKVRLSGLGVFQVRKRAARQGRNPNTGEAIKIKASKRVAFAVARDLKADL